MPLAVYILGLSIFAQGTSELMLAGLLPEMSRDLGVSIPEAGLLISAFAIGMLVGAPVLAIATLRWPRRTALLTFMLIFALSHVVGGLTSDYAVVFATRVAGAFVYAGFWAVAASTAIGMVPANARGKAMSILAGGLTVATIIGLSSGTVIGQHLGWRAAFHAVAGLSALAAIGVFATIPGGRPEPGTGPRVGAELRAMLNPPLWLAYGTIALTTAALLASFSYLSVLLTGSTGLDPAWVPAVLALYGIGALIGITMGGRTADARPFLVLFTGVTGLIVTSAALAASATVPLLAVVLVFLLGVFGFGTNPALNARPFALAKDAPTLTAAMNVSSFNVGITVGPWLGGLAIGAGFGYPSVAWIGAVVGGAALGAVALAAALHRRTAPLQSAPISEVRSAA
ncbi:MFS transporter [Nonomuraea sp. KC401]|uniref:Cmx/CmrA family chloramphenicol efflux MFS transporter n=1 Tax=unclassified Nonomuraea TaxID=2593643 RepID=UPI0010FED39C|nr:MULTISPECIES: Cmx/CmrA family chloramphenicol efflux MFS transporter [unclassified Nonomuraea]NBE97891.1 Cmx/CmrA family chloramphenicol efflux MFS transporter [Nonomuraea sp. K271]TLF61914.1 MFS transporter [Nonomuraea sp. KC401]